MGVEANEGTQDGNGDGSGDGGGTGTGTRGRTQDGNGDEDGKRDGNEDGIGEGGREAKKRKKPHSNNSCRRHVGNGGDLSGNKTKRRQEKVGSVAANPDNLESNKEVGGGAHGTQGLKERVCPLCGL